MPDSSASSSVSRRTFLRAGAGAVAGAALARVAGGQAARRPNVVFILADDLGWRDTSLYGSTFYETPNLERLARRGMMFTQAYAANPLCSPTRASIMTGLWPARIGITAPVCHQPEERLAASLPERAAPARKVIPCESATRLKQEYYTLAEALHDAGYRTGHFGKWHLGPEPYDPLHQGFEVDVPHYPGPGPAGSYLAPWRFPELLKFTGVPGEHIEERLAREAVRFIRDNRERPFFLNYWCFSVHSPWGGKEELIRKYAAKADPRSAQRHPVYAAMVQSMDAAVGSLMQALDESHLTENTIVVFFSDNGGYAWDATNLPAYAGTPVTSNSPLRGGKATLYEGGTREPCIVVWPGHTAPGSSSEALIQSIDFFPTLLEMTGVKPAQPVKPDGLSIVPALHQQPLQRDALYCFFPHALGPQIGTVPGAWVRQGDWKLIRCFHDGPHNAHRYELYNLREDLSETTNRAATEPARVAAMDALIEGFLRETKAVLPKPNPAYNPGVGGWQPSAHAALSVHDRVLVIECRGHDPFIQTADVPPLTGELTVEVRVRSTAAGPFEVRWSTSNPQRPYHRDRMASTALPADGQWRTLRLKLGVTGTLAGLRCDPANAPGRVEIEAIVLFGPDGKPAREWRFGNDAAGQTTGLYNWSAERVRREG